MGARARNGGLSEQSSVVLLLFDLLGRAELSRDGQLEFARTAQFSSVQIDWIGTIFRERGCLCNGQVVRWPHPRHGHQIKQWAPPLIKYIRKTFRSSVQTVQNEGECQNESMRISRSTDKMNITLVGHWYPLVSKFVSAYY